MEKVNKLINQNLFSKTVIRANEIDFYTSHSSKNNPYIVREDEITSSETSATSGRPLLSRRAERGPCPVTNVERIWEKGVLTLAWKSMKESADSCRHRIQICDSSGNLLHDETCDGYIFNWQPSPNINLGQPYSYTIAPLGASQNFYKSEDILGGDFVPRSVKVSVSHGEKEYKKATVIWEKPKNSVSSYKVYAETSENYARIEPATTTETQYEFKLLVAGTTYRFGVSAMYEGCERPRSYSTEICTGEPNKVTGVKVDESYVSCRKLRVLWDTVGAVMHEITITSENPCFRRIDMVSAENGNYVMKGLTPNTKYVICVRAANSEGLGPFSDEIEVKTEPGTPQEVSLKVHDSVHDALLLSFKQAADGCKHYEAILKENGAEPKTVLRLEIQPLEESVVVHREGEIECIPGDLENDRQEAGDRSRFTFTNLTPDKEYFAECRAFYADGATGLSLTSNCCWTATDNTMVPTVDNVEDGDGKSSQMVKIAWNRALGCQEYRILVLTKEDEIEDTIAVGKGQNFFYRCERPAELYFFQMQSKNASNCFGKPSNKAKIQLGPHAPENVIATRNGEYIDVKWDAVDNVDHYVVEVILDGEVFDSIPTHRLRYTQKLNPQWESCSFLISGTISDIRGKSTKSNEITADRETEVKRHEDGETSASYVDYELDERDTARANPQPINDGSTTPDTNRVIASKDTTGDKNLRQIGNDIWMDEGKPLRPGYHIYMGEQRLETGNERHSVAVKIYHIVWNRDEDSAWFKEYSREVDNLRRLEGHDNVVRFIHSGVVKPEICKRIYIALDLCDITTLGDVELGGKEKYSTARNIFSQVCHGIRHLHQSKIVHLDLKPGNILFSSSGRKVLVTDFSISRHVEIKHEDEKTTIKKSDATYGGTLGWQAAEMLRNEGDDPDFLKADIFSLCLVGCHIFCNGFHPFSKEDDPKDKAYWHTNIKDKKDPNLKPVKEMEVDGFLVADLFTKMLSHDPKMRPDIEEVLQHFMFWSPYKRMSFFHDMQGVFKDLEKQKDKQWMKNAEIVLAFYPTRANNSESSDETDSCQDSNESVSEASERESSYSVSDDQGDSDHDLSQSAMPAYEYDEETFRALPSLSEIDRAPQRRRSTPEIIFKNGEDHPASPTRDANPYRLQDAYEAIPTLKKREIRDEYRRVITDRFLDKIKQTGSHFYEEADEGRYRTNSVADLTRCIRNSREHRDEPDVMEKARVSWEFWSELFPEFLPLLYRILEAVFNAESIAGESDIKTEYKKEAEAEAIDVGDLLEEARSRIKASKLKRK